MSPMLIDYYRSIEASSAQMLDAARAADWDEVVRCENVCAHLIEQLRAGAQLAELAPDERREKVRIMQRILHNDAQIRALVEPWLEHLERSLADRPRFLH